MTAMEKSWIGGACCFKCAHVVRGKPKCNVNPEYTGGDADRVCALFELDRTRWHDLTTQLYEWKNKVRHRKGRMSLEDFT